MERYKKPHSKYIKKIHEGYIKKIDVVIYYNDKKPASVESIELINCNTWAIHDEVGLFFKRINRINVLFNTHAVAFCTHAPCKKPKQAYIDSSTMMMIKPQISVVRP